MDLLVELSSYISPHDKYGCVLQRAGVPVTPM